MKASYFLCVYFRITKAPPNDCLNVWFNSMDDKHGSLLSDITVKNLPSVAYPLRPLEGALRRGSILCKRLKSTGQIWRRCKTIICDVPGVRFAYATSNASTVRHYCFLFWSCALVSAANKRHGVLLSFSARLNSVTD